jgi:hypothetical protein
METANERESTRMKRWPAADSRSFAVSMPFKSAVRGGCLHRLSGEMRFSAGGGLLWHRSSFLRKDPYGPYRLVF